MEKKGTGSGQAKEHGPGRKKLKLDRTGLNLNLSTSVRNGLKSDVKPPVDNVEKKKHDKIKSTINSLSPSVKKEIKSPSKEVSLLTDSDDIPLIAKVKAKQSSKQLQSPSNEKTNSSNGEHFKSKADQLNSKPERDFHTNLSSSSAVKKIKSESGPSSSSSKRKIDGAVKLKSKSDLPGSSKTDGTKKIKPASGSSGSPKVDGVKKIKSEGSSPKVDGEKKLKPDSGLLSPNREAELKVKVKSDSQVSSKIGGEKKIKSESGLPVSPKKEGDKKVKLKSDKIDGFKKVKSESSSAVSSSSDGERKPKPKVKSESGSEVSSKKEGEKKSKSKSDSADETKKVKSKSDGLISPKATIVKDKVKTDESDEDMPLAVRAKAKKRPDSAKKSSERKRKISDNSADEDYRPLAKAKKKSVDGAKESKKEKTKDKKKEKGKAKEKGKEKEKEKDKDKDKKEPKQKKPEEEVWKWWEEEKHPEGIKWLTLEHKGPYFPPEYEPLPDDVNFHYDGKAVKLSPKSEEVAGFYAKMLEHEYTTKKIFNDNFFQDWRKEMTDEERKLIKNLSKCNFREIFEYYDKRNEERKNMSKEEKQKLKEKNEEILQEYGYCIMDGHRERVGNFKIEPPGLFRGRGDHPKQGKLKKRVQAKDITINIGKDAKVPTPPEGQRWKAISHDNKVTWLACWIENIQGSYKYVMLNPTSRIKGEKDWQKYETARKLKDKIGKIRSDYTHDWRSKEMRLRQRGVALYFIDKLALRAGHEKDEDTADTVGCCSLRVEHIKLHREMDDKEHVVEFDFLGKDSVHYHNFVEVEKRVFKNLELFKEGKTDGDDLFDRLSTASLNKYLSELMEGLSAKVFRTYNASMTLQDQLGQLDLEEENVAAKVLGYNRANRAVAILCNHQRSVPKSFEQSMTNLQQKIEDKHKTIKEAKKEVKEIKAELKSSKTAALEKKYEKKKTALTRLQEQLFKLEVTQTDKEENKEIALGTSKLNYLDPRISVAWCRKNDVPIEKIYNKTQRQKFAWAIDMTEEDFAF